MARMTAARAAVEILRREGVSNAFGVPGAAINPFYAALKASGGIRTLQQCRQLLEAGATRLGSSASVSIMRELLKDRA